jgi:hypothetical protein
MLNDGSTTSAVCNPVSSDTRRQPQTAADGQMKHRPVPNTLARLRIGRIEQGPNLILEQIRH